MPEEIIQIENLDNIILDEDNSREERKANGRLVAVIVALFLIFLAIYHAWIRKTAVLAGILIPALIMILYGGWVVFLAKRDKRKRMRWAKKMEEAARREMALAIKANREAGSKDTTDTETTDSTSGKRKRRRPKRTGLKTGTSSHITKKWRDKKPSFRQRIFKQNAQTEALIKASRQDGSMLCRTCSAP